MALALKARRPVKLTLTREEDMHDHSNYPTADPDQAGRQERRHAAGRGDGPGHRHWRAYRPGLLVPGRLDGWLVSLYQFPNMRYHGRAVYTNKVPSCAMQGFGNPQMTFAVESLMDELAEKLEHGPDRAAPEELCGPGRYVLGPGTAVRPIVQSDGVPQLLREGAEMIGWDAEARLPEDGRQGATGGGIGLGRGFHTSSAGAPQPGDVIDFSGAMVKINQDGSVDVVTALMDHGGGTLEAFAKLSPRRCACRSTRSTRARRTCTTVYDVATHATRGVYAGGGAVLKAAQMRRICWRRPRAL